MSVKHKLSGFLTAVILAVVSFLAIYFFCPNFSQKTMGISFKYRNSVDADLQNKLDSIPSKIESAVDSAAKRINLEKIVRTKDGKK